MSIHYHWISRTYIGLWAAFFAELVSRTLSGAVSAAGMGNITTGTSWVILLTVLSTIASILTFYFGERMLHRNRKRITQMILTPGLAQVG